MSQKYTEVEWTDETPTEPGTLINKARLDQMQSAHHYADGFEEVDTIPTADPGVDYHKVVYCTADSTFYRWDGAQWTKDIDDETKALLLAHEADHSNPHVVTKAQVGLGDVVDKGMDDAPTDSSDNYVKSGGVKTALDGKLNVVTTTSGLYFYAQNPDGQTRYYGTSNAATGSQTVAMREANGRLSVSDPVGAENAANKRYVDNALIDKLDDSQLVTSWGSPVSDSKIASEKLTKDTLDTKADTTALTDGSVTKVGTGNVGTDTKPIKLVAGVPTAVTNTLIDDTSTQIINATKIFSHTAATTVDGNNPKGAVEKLTNITVNSTTANRYFYLAGARDSADKLLAGINMRYNANGDVHFALATTDSAGELTAQEIARFYRSTGTWGSVLVSDALDAYAPMVRTANAQTIAGIKTFTDNIALAKNTPLINISINNYTRGTAPGSSIFNGVRFIDSANAHVGGFRLVNDSDGNRVMMEIYNNGGSNTSLAVFNKDGGTAYVTAPSRAYNASNTSDVVTLSLLDAYTPMVRVTNNQTIGGIKTFTSNPIILGDWPNLQIKTSAVLDGSAHEDRGNIVWRDNNNNIVAQLRFNMGANNTTQIQLVVKNSDNTDKYVTLAAGDVI